MKQNLKTIEQDVKQQLPVEDCSIDEVYSHMLFSMAFATTELESLSNQVNRILRPNGLLL